MMAPSIGPVWDQVRLDEVAVRGSGHTPNKKHPEYWDGGIPWISLKDTFRLDRRAVTSTTDTITAEGLAHSSAVLHPRGTVVLLRDAGIGKSGIMGADMAVSQHFMAWRCGAKLDNWFLYYYLQCMKPEFERISNGSTIKTIGLDYFKQFTVPLPSIVEQRSISLMLRESDDLIATLERLIAKKQAIKQGMVQQLLTGRTRLPGFTEPWSETNVGSIASISMGQSPAGSTYNSDGHGLPLIQGNADIRGRVTFDRIWTTAPTKTCEAGDVLLTVRAPVGYTAIASKRSCLGRGVCAIRASRDNRFLFHALVYAEPAWKLYAQGSTFTAVNSNEVRSFVIQWPSDADERAVIATVLDDADRELTALQTHLTKARAIKTGMMQQLLTGRTRLPVEAAS